MTRQLTRRQFLIGTTLATGAVLGGGAGSYIYAHKIEPHWLDQVDVALTLAHLDPAFDGFRLAQLSDVHLGDWTTYDWLVTVIGEINRLQPDAVVITGDLVTGRARPQAADLKRAFRQIEAPAYAIAGNHDHWGWIPVFREIMQESGVVNLNNSVHTLQRGTAELHLAGLDDVWMNRHDMDKILSELPPNGPAILLVHEPDYADTSAEIGRFALQLSGHSHGGQVRFPVVGAPLLPYLGQKYPRGLYQVGDMYLYTNRGMGMVNPPFRFGNRPEITHITLKAQPS